MSVSIHHKDDEGVQVWSGDKELTLNGQQAWTGDLVHGDEVAGTHFAFLFEED